MNYLKLSCLALLATSFGFADEAIVTSTIVLNPKTETPFIEYHNRMIVFSPFYQGYERIKTDDLYFGLQAWLIPAGSHHKMLGEVEFLGGYNFFYNGRDHLTPVVGVGLFTDYSIVKHSYYFWDDNGSTAYSHHHKNRVAYGTVGFLYDHEFNRLFNVGLNVKALAGSVVGPRRAETVHKTTVGFDVAIPLTFRFGKNRHWDFRLEPFDIYMYRPHDSNNYYGFRNSIGYRF